MLYSQRKNPFVCSPYILYVIYVVQVCVGEIYSTSIRPPELPLLFYKTQLSCYAFNRWPPEPRRGKRARKRVFLT